MSRRCVAAQLGNHLVRDQSVALSDPSRHVLVGAQFMVRDGEVTQ